MRGRSRHWAVMAAVTLALLLAAGPARAADWSNTEMHIQYGELDTPFLGFIDEIKIFNRPLSEDEIRAVFLQDR